MIQNTASSSSNSPLYEGRSSEISPLYDDASKSGVTADKTPVVKDPSSPMAKREVKVLDNQSSQVKPYLRLVGWFILSFPASFVPKLHQITQFKMAHARRDRSLNPKECKELWNKANFGDNLMGVARNLSQNEHQVGQKERKASEEIVAKGKELLESLKGQDPNFKFVGLNEKEKQKAFSTDGICHGITTYLAKETIVTQTPIETLVNQLKKGGPIEAAANQHLYSASFSKGSIVSDTKDVLARLDNLAKSASANDIPNFSSRAIEAAIIEADKELGPFLSQEQPVSERDQKFVSLIKNTISEIKAKEEGDPLYQGIIAPDGKSIEDLQKFKKIVQSKIDQKFLDKHNKLADQLKERAFNTNSLNWMVSLLEMKSSSAKNTLAASREKISDPVHRSIVNKVINRNVGELNRTQIVNAYNGLTETNVEHVMGNSFFLENDLEYLKNAEKLDPGSYRIIFSTGSGHHAIFYKKNEDGSGYIIDPNAAMLSFSKADTLQMLTKVIGLYEEPDEKALFAGQGSHHSIVFTKFEQKPNIQASSS